MKENIFDIIVYGLIAMVSFIIHEIKSKKDYNYGDRMNVGFWYNFGWLELGSMTVYIVILIGF